MKDNSKLKANLLMVNLTEQTDQKQPESNCYLTPSTQAAILQQERKALAKRANIFSVIYRALI